MQDARFTALAERLSTVRQEDAETLQRIRAEIVELKLLLERLQQRELADFLGAADSMVRSIGVLEGEAFAQVRDLIASLVGVVAEAVSGLGAPAMQAQPPSALPADVQVALDSRPSERARPRKLHLEGEGSSSAHSGLHTMSELLLGQILIDSGKLTRAKLVAALKLQTQERMRIGEALQRLGHVTAEDVDAALEAQRELAEGLESSGEMRGSKLLCELTLGEILTRIGGVSESDLERALQVQRATGKRLGEALVELGATTWSRIHEATRIQERNRGATAWDRLGAQGGFTLRLDD